MKQASTVVLLITMISGMAPCGGAQSLRTPRAESKAERSSTQPGSRPAIAITFDDLPQVGVLPAGEDAVSVAKTLVSELKVNHLEGTYGFVNGDKIVNRPGAPQALQIWLDGGMNIGNHTWSHMRLTTNSVETFEQDVAQNEPALAQYGEVRDWRWFRYPYLEEGETLEKRRAVREYLRRHGYKIAQVTLQFADYEWNGVYVRCRTNNDDAAIAKLTQTYLDAAAEDIKVEHEEEQLVFGREIPEVLLLHETPFTTLMLPELLDLLRANGFAFENLAQVESDAAYAVDPDAGSQSGGTLTEQLIDARHLARPPAKPDPYQQVSQLCQ